MLSTHNHADNWREALKIISRCPICGETYHAEEAKLFAKHETASLVHITCHHCQSSFVAMIVMLGQGLSSVGMVTDLNFTDIERLHKVSPLTTDEMIEGYQQIQQNKFVQQTLKILA